MIFSTRRGFEGLQGYEFGERTAGISGIVRLNTNEAATPFWDDILSVSVKKATLHRYPDPSCLALREGLAMLHKVPPDWILIGNGSDELLSLAARAFIDPGDRVALLDHTYKLYETLIRGQLGEVVEIAADELFGQQAWEGRVGTKLSFIARPNSPCGRVLPKEMIWNWPTPIVLDEAYAEFMDENLAVDVCGLVQSRADVIVLRTLSKAWGLAGLRIGYAIARPETLARLTLIKDSYSVSTISCMLGAAAVARPEIMRMNVALTRMRRDQLLAWMQDRGMDVGPSHGNFLWWLCGSVEEMTADLRKAGVVVRGLRYSCSVSGIRCTVGNDADIAALKGAINAIQIEK